MYCIHAFQKTLKVKEDDTSEMIAATTAFLVSKYHKKQHF